MSIDLNYGEKVYARYTKFCEKNVTDDIAFKNFRNHPDYTYVLEHVTKEYGLEYLNDINQLQYNINWEQIKKSDSIGSPIIYEYSNIGKISPTTIRYIHTGLKILEWVKNDKEISIVEIGGGYGGQCKILFDLSHLFNIKIKSYTILDLYYPNLVQRKFLKETNIQNVNCTTVDKYTPENIDLLISNYALSEIGDIYQREYIHIIQKSKKGYFLWNMTPIILSEILDKNPTITNEYPETFCNNKLVRY